jgi:putative flippase GtrA
MKQILRFGVVGATAFLIDYGLLYALTDLSESIF